MLRLAVYISYISSLTPINSYSLFDKNLLRVARKLDEGQDGDYSWLIDYSLKFSSCHTVQEYSNDADGAISTNKLVQFRICSSEQCSWQCVGGRYLVQMEDFLQAYVYQKQANENDACEQVREQCQCGDDDWDECEENCFSDAGLDYCVEGNNDDEAIDIDEFIECQKLDMEDEDDEDNEQNQYYIGPKCSESGKEINLGLFTDEYCTIEKENTDDSLSFPYQSESIVTDECFSCAYEDKSGDNDENGDDGVSYEVSDMCMGNYVESVKCEQDLNVYYPNTDACDLIDSMHIPGDKFSSHYTTIMLAAGIFFFFSFILVLIIIRLLSAAKKKAELSNEGVGEPLMKPRRRMGIKSWFRRNR